MAPGCQLKKGNQLSGRGNSSFGYSKKIVKISAFE